MKTRIRHLWEQLRSTYWFIPMAMVAVAVMLSTASVLLDRAIQEEGTQSLEWLYSGGPAEARSPLDHCSLDHQRCRRHLLDHDRHALPGVIPVWLTIAQKLHA